MTRSMNRILGVAGAVLLITLLAIGIGAHPDVRVSAASCSVSGVISTDTTWSPTTCDPYIVTASVVVPSGVTLTIEAGTTVKFDSLKGLLVQGTLVARGTASNAITFTSNQATPAKGDWGNIHFMDSSTDATFDGSGNYAGGSIVQYAIIEYAGYVGVGTAIGALTIEASSPYIDHNTIRNNRASGIYASASGALRVTNNTITGNTVGNPSYPSNGGGISAG
ncbi:MAG: hypothetical protein Q8O86_09880, partial [Dehalococcoidia bacterium]|nr:hypothetical protein [Dehalococcoidia bacterium]